MINCNLETILKSKNMTKKTLSELTLIRSSTISAYCNNEWKSISREHLNSICRILRITPNELIEFTLTDEDDINFQIKYEDKLAKDNKYRQNPYFTENMMAEIHKTVKECVEETLKELNERQKD